MSRSYTRSQINLELTSKKDVRKADVAMILARNTTTEKHELQKFKKRPLLTNEASCKDCLSGIVEKQEQY